MTIFDSIRYMEKEGILTDALSRSLEDYHKHDYEAVKTWDAIICYAVNTNDNNITDDTDQILSNGVVQRFIKAHNINVKQTKRDKHFIYYVDCINSDKHTTECNDTEAFISVSPSGVINFHCNHSHCDGIHWQEYKRYYESRDDVKTDDKSKRKTALQVHKMSEIVIRKTEFLYKPMFPEKLCIISGYPGAGKTFILCQLAASVSTGKPFFHMRPEYEEPRKVLYFSSEDGYDDTIAPRLLKCGANMDKIGYVHFDDSDDFDFSDGRLEDLIKEIKPALVIFDTLQNFIGNVNMNAANETTRKMRPLVRLADTYNVCIVCVCHFNKNEQGAAITRTIGSTDITGKCRSYMTIGNVPESDGIKYLSHEKTNVGEMSDTILFSINERGIRAEGTTSQRADDFAQQRKSKKGRPSNELQTVKEFIVRNMPDGKRASNEMLKLCSAHGFADRTVDRAKKELSIGSVKEGMGGSWYWIAPEGGFDDFDPVDYSDVGNPFLE